MPSNSAKRLSEVLLLVVVCAAFVALAWPFLKRMGIEADEALIGNGLFGRVPDLGGLKTWLYAPIFAVWDPSAVSVRLPGALAGAGTLVLFWRLLHDVCGTTAAWIGAVLLAAETSCLLLTTIHFGRVALQLCLKTAALVLLVRWRRQGRIGLFASAWFLLGLALWDKAIFAWIAAGLTTGALAAIPRIIRAAIRPRLVSIAAAAFCAGSFPLIAYKIAWPLDTIRSNAKVSSEQLVPKIAVLRDTVDGSVLSGFYTALDTPPQPGSLDRPLRRALARISADPATNPHNWPAWAFAGAILALPAIWHVRGGLACHGPDFRRRGGSASRRTALADAPTLSASVWRYA